ncbi:hypothetical protein [Chitinibacter sp. GC72]|uniref:hypothetical protein n=1 Tax=Chitinibacter sp. GC72 TaxID=1526917 RepID=UPI0012FC1D79|nr:hypothetical protein [Chitinibacter sp. GC72]
MKRVMGLSFFVCLSINLSGCNNQNVAASTEQASSAAIASQSTKQLTSQIKQYDGPFGLAASISREELVHTFGFTPSKTSATLLQGTPPKPSNLFTEYSVIVSKKSGLCKIVAYTPELEFNDNGDQIKERTDSIAETLAVKYSKGKHYKYVKGSYTEPEFWAMAAKEDQAVYAYVWEESALSKIDPNLGFLSVEVASYGDYKTGQVKVIYQYKNMDDCVKESKESQADNL